MTRCSSLLMFSRFLHLFCPQRETKMRRKIRAQLLPLARRIAPTMCTHARRTSTCLRRLGFPIKFGKSLPAVIDNFITAVSFSQRLRSRAAAFYKEKKITTSAEEKKTAPNYHVPMHTIGIEQHGTTEICCAFVFLAALVRCTVDETISFWEI